MLMSWLRAVWNGFRQVSGDDAFERYIRHHNRVHPEAAPLDRKTFFKSELQRRWDGVRRCC